MTHVQLIDQGIIQSIGRQKISDAGTPLVFRDDIRRGKPPLLLVGGLLPLEGNERDLVRVKTSLYNAAGRRDVADQQLINQLLA